VNEHLNFEIEQTDIVDENPDSQFATAKVRVFSSGDSRNNTYCSEEALQATAYTIDNKPIVYGISKVFGDFSTHQSPEDTLIAGFAVPGSQEFERLSDNRLSLSVLVKLWKRYSPKAMEIFKKDGGKKKVSVEVDLLDGEEDSSGKKNMKKFCYNAICILGDLVTEASPGAQLEMMSFSEENKKYKEAYDKEFSFKYDGIDLSVPENVKKNINKGLDLYKEYGIGGNSVSLASARFVFKNDNITSEKLRHIAKVHKSNKFQNKIKSPPNEDYISYMLYGGKDGMVWANEISNKLDEQDSKQLNYFSEEITFPYKSVGDANPALRGVDPPLSVGQMNSIASQADGIIKKDSKANGWAIAIGNFRRSHIVKDGHWIEKGEKNMDEEVKDKEEIEEMAEKPKIEDPEKEKAEDPKEEEKETPEQEKSEDMAKEPEQEKMSLDWNADTAVFLALLEDETEKYQAIASEEFAKPEGERNFAKVAEMAYGKMCKMAKKMEKMEEDGKAYMAENETLKKFKADIEEKKKEFAIEETLHSILENSIVPEEKISEMRSESKNFSLDDLDAWKNSCKAIAFDFPKVEKKDKEKEEVRYAFSWLTDKEKENVSLWKKENWN
jgi:hypothetical protein